MKSPRPVVVVAIVAALLASADSGAADSGPAGLEAAGPIRELAGLWRAQRDFGPEVAGILTLSRRSGKWVASIAGYTVEATVRNGVLRFELPGDRGAFSGHLTADGRPLPGHWVQPRLVTQGQRFASPVRFSAAGPEGWRGEVDPLHDRFTLFLHAGLRGDGSLGAFLRNPERNQGVFWNVDRLERQGDTVSLIGPFFRRSEEQILAQGTYRPDDQRLSVYFGSRGGTYDFERVDGDPASQFYARGHEPGPWSYQRPPQLGDGWAVGSLEEVGIAVGPLRAMIEKEIEPPADSVHSLYVHGLLLARHGKLVFEEYFHGFHRDEPHDTRSASKSLTAALVGAAIQEGAALTPMSSVLDVLFDGNPPAGTDPRKARLSVEHLLTMSSGLDCDDRDSSSPGAEDVMQEQSEEPDWYRYTLALGMVREPGTEAVYCSINPNLLGAVLAKATGESLPDLFNRLIAEPLQVDRYYLNLQPTGEPYMGGGIHWLPRDFMKLGQLMVDGGVWNGRRVVSETWARRSTMPLVELRGRKYGYLWWIVDMPYGQGTVRAFFAGGNGGQVVIGIPELDLVIAAYAGNYSDPVLYRIQEELVPQYILPAVAAGG
jgi:CubicO group peptidase (beta-lactamase class C family)